MAATTHEVRQRPALRALGLAALLELVGLVVLLMANLLEPNPFLAALGLAAIGAGLVLFVIAVWTARSRRVAVVLDEDGYEIRADGAGHSGRWANVARVTQGRDRITLHQRDGSRVQLVVVRGGSADLDALGADIASRLDADRGYGSRPPAP